MKNLSLTRKGQIAFYGTGLFIAVTIIALRYERIPSAWELFSLWALGIVIVGMCSLAAGLLSVRVLAIKVPEDDATMEERLAWKTEFDKLIIVVCVVLIGVCLCVLVGWYKR